MSNFTAQTVKEALESAPRLWLYPVSSFDGKKESGWIAFSRDDLVDAVAQRITRESQFKGLAAAARWVNERLPMEIETVLRRHKMREGFAVLEGVTRPVWVIPQSHLPLARGKKLKSQPVTVTERLA